eukprot:364721-Chlamydomonas_euryale.AAC.25
MPPVTAPSHGSLAGRGGRCCVGAAAAGVEGRSGVAPHLHPEVTSGPPSLRCALALSVAVRPSTCPDSQSY